MRKLVKLVLLCLIAYPIAGIVSSCSEEEDCSMNARPMMQCKLYTIDRETPEKNLEKVPVANLKEIGRRVEALGIKASVAG